MTLIFAAVLLTSGAVLALWWRRRARQAEALAQVREAALDSLAHDLRTPLTAILGAATALESLDASLTPDKRASLAAAIAAGARELDRSIHALLEARRGGANGPADLSACATAALRRLDGALDRHTIEVRIAEDAAFAAADPALLELALANLIGNAARHGPSGGKIGVESRTRRGAIILSVSDEGAGLPRARTRLLRTSVPDPRRGLGGAGLGLGIARGFAMAMGGDLRFSTHGGSRAEIVLKPAPVGRHG